MMKTIEVYTKEDQQFLDLHNGFTGELGISLCCNPLDLAEKRRIQLHFDNGVAAMAEVPKVRCFYKGTIDEETYIGAQRRVPIPGLYNCRDLGGYPTDSGTLTKWGLIYRSDAPDHLEETDVAYLEKMTFASVIDLRAPAEIALRPDIPFGEVHHYNFDPHAKVARRASETPSATSNKDKQKVEKLVALSQTQSGQAQLIEMQQQMVVQMRDLVLSEQAKVAYTNFLQVLLRGEVPTLFHCQGGKDRTGWAAAIILGLLGVSKDIIYQDYFLTEACNRPRNEQRMAVYKQYTNNRFVLDYLGSLQQTKAEYLDSAFQTMEEAYGGMEEYAKQALGVTEVQLNQLRERYLYPV